MTTDGRECVLCGDYQPSHIGGPCRVRNYYGPGRNDYTVCECPGYEPQRPEEQDPRDDN